MTQLQKPIDPVKVFIVFLIFLGMIAFFLNGFIHLYKNASDAEQYKKAPICKYGTYTDNCRRETEAEILDSSTFSIDRRYRRRRLFDFETYPKILSYDIKVKYAHGETYTITLLPYLNINSKDFMSDHVYLPAPQNGNEKMAETSFVKGHMVKIEMWNNKPSMIYSRYVLGAPVLSGKNEYAIPTEDNPLVYAALERDNFVKTSAGLVIAFLVILALFFLR